MSYTIQYCFKSMHMSESTCGGSTAFCLINEGPSSIHILNSTLGVMHGCKYHVKAGFAAQPAGYLL